MQHFRLCNALLQAAICVIMASAVSMETTVTCEGNGHVQRLSCDYGVISVQAALYGRADSTTCSLGRPLNQLANTNCAAGGTVDIVRSRCEGMPHCEFNADIVKNTDPCGGTYKYLETNFTCIPAIQVVECEHSVAHLSCHVGQVIHVYSAHYGRLDSTTCTVGRPESQVQNINCVGLTTKVAESCNGTNNCEVQATNSVFGDPCGGTYKYLQVAYTCEYPTVADEENSYYYSDLK